MIKKCLLLNSDGIKISLKQETQMLRSQMSSVKIVSRITNPSSGVKHTWRICSRD